MMGNWLVPSFSANATWKQWKKKYDVLSEAMPAFDRHGATNQ
jgi:hypothetical protein